MPKANRKKLVVVGDGFCGKTSLLHAYSYKQFPERYVPTVFENTIEIINHESGKVIELALWDTAGQEEYDRLRPLCYPETDVILACFAIDQAQSFDNISDRWIPEMDHFLPNTPRLLVGTKGDLRHDNQRLSELQAVGQNLITVEQAKALARKLNIQYIECSAKTLSNVNEVMLRATDLIVNNRKRGLTTRICNIL